MPSTADPRPSNHGGHTPTPPPLPTTPETGIGSRFDWYESTHDDLDDGRVAPALALATGGRILRGKSRNGYSRGEIVMRGDDVLATVHGGSSRVGEVHITVTSNACDEVVPIIRRLWPEHRCSRVDSALDFSADFDTLDASIVQFARDRGLKHALTTNSEGGATRYVGSARSEVRVRLYKKSEQLRAEHPELAAEIPDGIVRAEIVARPGNRETKGLLARLEPDHVWGLGEWAQQFARAVLDLDPVRTPTHARRPADWSRALLWMGRQYSQAVAERAADVGLDQVRAEVLDVLGLA